MLLAHATKHHISLLFVEGGLTAVAVAASLAWPRLGSAWFVRIEQAFGRLARRKGLAVASVGFSVLLLRLAILPVFPVPLPFCPNDFSFLLAADTFSLGRLTNPTPAMWKHFESIHITMQPTYMSMYFPGNGLLLAAGQLLFGNPWIGNLCVDMLMCASICWMLQAWLPPGWALFGGIVAMLRIGLYSYWINTIFGGEALLAALGGALVLGALPRLMRTGRFRYSSLMAVGIVILALTRPYEGMLLCLPVAAALGRWALFGKNRPSRAVLLRRAVVPLALIAAVLAWLGYYNYRAFGGPTILPYTVNRATYATAPYFVWQPARPAPHYRYEVMRRFYAENELRIYEAIHSLAGFLPQTLIKAARGILFFAGLALLPPLVMLRRVLLDRRMRFLVLCMFVLMAGMSIEVFLVPHYLAVFTAVFYALGLQAMRHLRFWKPAGEPVGTTLTRLIVALCVALAGVRIFATPLKLSVPEWPASSWSGTWYGPDHYGMTRAQVEGRLERLPGSQLVIVRYLPGHNPLDEWVYNQADIDKSKVIWARAGDAASNLELLHYYYDRKAWLVEPDTASPAVIPYPAPLAAVSP